MMLRSRRLGCKSKGEQSPGGHLGSCTSMIRGKERKCAMVANSIRTRKDRVTMAAISNYTQGISRGEKLFKRCAILNYARSIIQGKKVAEKVISNHT